ncbi:hypothetical protein AMTRI_Chr04g245690 [Amborella trichopoda]|uniref:uncharacterized protein LOC110008015 isoform X2 n=1 Tax=Amborella trichopoda TaxID=13333 RepID=UPI0009C07467|nr:uncharacterized protein LOC110008015 isoform X2 [Amborella trichopoda]|eukprot:XP_020528575.1 uncharacterized protein LOC110008015 isoform X2 [Amborella trichopoda]
MEDKKQQQRSVVITMYVESPPMIGPHQVALKRAMMPEPYRHPNFNRNRRAEFLSYAQELRRSSPQQHPYSHNHKRRSKIVQVECGWSLRMCGSFESSQQLGRYERIRNCDEERVGWVEGKGREGWVVS